MRISAFITSILAVCMALTGWCDHRLLTEARARYDRLVRQAGSVGMALETGPSEHISATRGTPRRNADVIARSVVAAYIAFGKELEPVLTEGRRLDTAMQRRQAEMRRLLGSLNGGQLEIVLSEIVNARELTEPTRHALVVFAVRNFASVMSPK